MISYNYKITAKMKKINGNICNDLDFSSFLRIHSFAMCS